MNSENNTLVILTPGFPESEIDTVCLPMQQNFVRALKKNYPQLNIVILAFQYPYFKRTYQWFDTTVISFNGQNKSGLARLMLRRELKATLKEINRNNKIRGILSFWYGECTAVGKKFADKNDLKHYCWLLGQDAKKGNKYIKYTRLKGNELIALSEFIQNEFEKNYGAKPQFVIPPGIDTKQFTHPIKEKDIDIIAAGSLIGLKQYEIFILTIAEIKKQVPGIKAMLVGDGPEKNKLQTLIVTLGLESNIILAGELPHPEVLRYMQRGKIFLHPSSYEGFGVVCIEALAAGCRVISFCKPMKQEIEQWYIVQSKEEMKLKALGLLQNEQLEYRCVASFTIDDTVKKMIDLFDT
jgi:glycosyltransferase involved in cell wall biosynthesis